MNYRHDSLDLHISILTTALTHNQVSLGSLINLRNGKNALDFYNNGEDEDSFDERSSADPGMSSSTGKRTRTKQARDGFVGFSGVQLGSDDDELAANESIVKKRRLAKGRISLITNNSSRQGSRVSSRISTRPPSRLMIDEDSSDSEESLLSAHVPKHGKQPTRSSTRNTRGPTAKPLIHLKHKAVESDDESDELAGDGVRSESDNSDIVYTLPYAQRPTKDRKSRSQSKGKRGRPRKIVDESSAEDERPQPTRRSGRERQMKSMRERDMDEEIYADEVSINNAPKVISIREIYQPIPKQSRFAQFHNKDCDVCDGTGTQSNKGTSPLIYCQGCSSSIHKVCLGYRSGRDHLVTKVGHENFVLQCRRCIGIAAKKDPSAPRLEFCSECQNPGLACAAFAPKRTPKQEEKLREENDGDDPITEVSPDLINNAGNVLFRCSVCQRGWHFDHLPPLSKSNKSKDMQDLHDQRLREYSAEWKCKDCNEVPAKVQGLVAWRPTNRESYVEGNTEDEFREDEKEYLVKWEDTSYFSCSWMPGAWVWGVTSVIMRKAFYRREEGINLLPKWTAEEAIPEEFLRIEIVFDVRYDNEYQAKSEASDKAHISNVDQVLVKFQGLGYDEAVWEEPPSPDETDRWSDFVAAYNEWVVGKYFKLETAAVMKERIDQFRKSNFEKKVELKQQPSALIGGQIMPYQMEGLNWLLYNFHQKKNVILADEMGLGKTIQIISLIASLVKDKPKVRACLAQCPRCN